MLRASFPDDHEEEKGDEAGDALDEFGDGDDSEEEDVDFDLHDDRDDY